MTSQHSTSTTASFDVAIIGAGPAGCSAGVFCARADLETVVLANGRSTLRKCAIVENYPGFPFGVEPRRLLELFDEHARRAGCDLRERTVEAVRRSDEGFEIITDDGTVSADRVVAASWSESDYLADLAVEREPEESGSIDVVRTDADGETAVDGLYAAGRITDTYHQAIVNAGDGARVALSLVNDLVPEFYNDWVAPEGYYASYDREVPVGVEEIPHDERRRRIEQGHERMREALEDSELE